MPKLRLGFGLLLASAERDEAIGCGAAERTNGSPMSVSTKGEFFRLLKRSDLLSTEDRVEAKLICQGLTDARQVAAALVKRSLLTEWQAAQLLLGRSQFLLGKYRLLKFRGRGAMGIVFKAQHPDFDRCVAIKVLPKSIVDRPRSVARFLREIRSTAALNHPNLVVAYDADEIDGTYCLVMEYVTGRSLKMLLQQFGRLPPRWACDCMRQAALALQHIHDCGLVHRDIKPSNLMVTTIPPDERPVVKLLDIGLARFVSEVEEDGGLTRAGQIVGTGNYMAPEQVTDARKADIRADIYGLGVTFFELLTGTCPLAGQTLVQTYMNRLRGEAPRVSTLCPNVPRGLDAVIAKMLKRDAGERYQSPAALAADLSAILEGSPDEVEPPFFTELPAEEFQAEEANFDSALAWPSDHRATTSLPTDPTLSADCTVPLENAATDSPAVPFAIEAPWLPFDSSAEVSVIGATDGSTGQPSGQPFDPTDSSVVEFLQLLDHQSGQVFRQFGPRYTGKSPLGGLPGLAAQSSQFLRDLVQGLAGKARSKSKKRVAPKTGHTRKASGKSKRDHSATASKSRRSKTGSHSKIRKPASE
jgi:serine/threonine protein kinase